jgi:hypothetical protein
MSRYCALFDEWHWLHGLVDLAAVKGRTAAKMMKMPAMRMIVDFFKAHRSVFDIHCVS